MNHWPILIIFGMQHYKKVDANVCGFSHLTLMLSLHYLVKCRVAVWKLTTMNSYWVAHALAQKLLT